ncbi:MAG TPA: amidohydrolase family protein, partial [Solirubrobacteraceae bacterium]|nr:amidohydrolase family protein [Solirubrobacteraceae bacterium]
LEQMARRGQFLVPTLSCFYGVAGMDDPAAPGAPAETWSPLLVELAEYNLEQADRTLRAARAAGVRIAMGYDWAPLGGNAIEIVRMVRHGLTTREALVAATATAADALGLAGHVGTVEPGKLADLLVIDGDPLDDCELLLRRERIWLVVQLGRPVAGAVLERDLLAAAPAVAT